MKIIAFVGVCFALLMIQGCAPKKPDIENQLKKKWTISETDSTYIQFLKSKDGELHFKSNAPEFLAYGNWEIQGDTVINLLGDPKVSEGQISSIKIKNDSLKSNFVLLDSTGKELGKLNLAKNKVEFARIKQSFQIKELALAELELTPLNAASRNGSDSIKMKFVSKHQETSISFISILRGLLGLVTLIMIAWLFSTNKAAVNWKLVAKGLGIQILFALLILKVPFVESFFEFISSFFVEVINFTGQGSEFLFKSFITNKIEGPLVNFVVQVLPTIIFFSALTSLFYYWGVLQKVVYVFAWVMRRIMGLSGAESMAAAGNVFLGQTEAPLLIKPYLGKMTKSEVMTLMVGGMATIAGGVMASYIGFLGGDDPVEQLYFAKHLLAASVMSAPAAIVAAKIIFPESEEFNKEMKIPKSKLGSNALDAITNGTTDGIRLAVNVAGMLLVFIALMAMANHIMEHWIGQYTGLNEVIADNTRYNALNFQFLLGNLMAPIAWLMGVPNEDIFLVGQLLGEKTILNEFVAYVSLGDMKMKGEFVHEKSILMATYMLCGFANIASIGIQIGGIGALVPERKSLLAELGVKALIGGTLACLFTAVVVGMLS